jgi:hypothetical protein
MRNEHHVTVLSSQHGLPSSRLAVASTPANCCISQCSLVDRFRVPESIVWRIAAFSGSVRFGNFAKTFFSDSNHIDM